MIEITFYVSLLAITCIVFLLMWSLMSEHVQFFPPPGKDTWQYKLFWGLFRLMFYGLVLLSILDFGSYGYVPDGVRFALGLPILIFGFGAAFYLTFILGWKNAHGEKQGLITSGWYRFSRNPIYVVSIIGMVGWGLLVDSLRVDFLLSLWAFFYILAPFIEERWLVKKYGNQFIVYKSEVHRFIGTRKRPPTS